MRNVDEQQRTEQKKKKKKKELIKQQQHQQTVNEWNSPKKAQHWWLIIYIIMYYYSDMARKWYFMIIIIISLMAVVMRANWLRAFFVNGISSKHSPSCALYTDTGTLTMQKHEAKIPSSTSWIMQCILYTFEFIKHRVIGNWSPVDDVTRDNFRLEGRKGRRPSLSVSHSNSGRCCAVCHIN